MEVEEIVNLLRPNEIAFLGYVDGTFKNQDLPEYWKYYYGINFKTIFDKFINFNLLECKKDLIYTIKKKYTISDLKSILSSNGLPTTGKKDILIDRIISNLGEQALIQNLNTTFVYKLTDLGKAVVKKYELFIINRKENLNLDEKRLKKIYIKYPKENDSNVLLIKILKEEIDYYIKKNKWNMVSVRVGQLAQTYFKIDDYNNAITYFIAKLRLHLSCFGDDNYLSEIKNISIFPQELTELNSLINITNISKNDLFNYINNEPITPQLPFNYFDNKETFKIICDLLDGKEFIYKNYHYKKPISNSTLYTYYNFSDDDDNDNIFKTIFNKIFKK